MKNSIFLHHIFCIQNISISYLRSKLGPELIQRSSVIGFPELVNTAKNVVANTMSAFQVWTIVAVMYLVVITLLSRLAKKVERRLNRGRQ